MNDIQLSKNAIVYRKKDKGQRKFVSALILTQKEFFNPTWKKFFLIFYCLLKVFDMSVPLVENRKVVKFKTVEHIE